MQRTFENALLLAQFYLQSHPSFVTASRTVVEDDAIALISGFYTISVAGSVPLPIRDRTELPSA